MVARCEAHHSAASGAAWLDGSRNWMQLGESSGPSACTPKRCFAAQQSRPPTCRRSTPEAVMLSRPTLRSQEQRRSNAVGTSTSSSACLLGGPGAAACSAGGVAQPNAMLDAVLLATLPAERCARRGSCSPLPAAAASMRRSQERMRLASAAAGRHRPMAMNISAVLAIGFSKFLGWSSRPGPCDIIQGLGCFEAAVQQSRNPCCSMLCERVCSQRLHDENLSCACLQLVEDLAQEGAGRAGEQEGEHKGSAEAGGGGHGRRRRAGAETASAG